MSPVATEPAQTTPDPASLRRLLDSAFDGWGDADYFRWKYADFPGYDPAAHNFVVERDGEVVAARRVFPKPLVTPAGERTVHVHGGTAVARDYRNRGLYTRLVEQSRGYSEAAGSPAVLTFNREGKITTAAHRRRGWSSRTLPLSILPRSPGALVAEYAGAVVGDRPALTAAARATASRLGPRGLARAVEFAANGDRSLSGAVRTAAAATGDLRPRGRDPPAPPATGHLSAVVSDYRPADADAVLDLFDAAVARHDVAFARGTAELEHMLDAPRSDGLVARVDGDVAGFAAVGVVDRGALTEARVLDVVAEGDDAEAALLAAVERAAADRDADVVSLVHPRSPDPRWARLRTEYVMWDWLTDLPSWGHALTTGRWRLTGYDVL